MAIHSSILTWKSQGQRSLVDYTPRGSQSQTLSIHTFYSSDILRTSGLGDASPKRKRGQDV